MKTLSLVGLGKMGAGLCLQAAEKGWHVRGYDKVESPYRSELEAAGVEVVPELKDLATSQEGRRAIFLYIDAGKAIDQVISHLAPHLSPRDIIVDGGNSYWGDSMARAKALAKRGIEFIDLGTSGGLIGAREGACFMAGGTESAVEFIQPLLESLAVPGGFVFCGPSGSGHYVKLVHNGIEFGMMQAIAEGIQLLERWDHPLPVKEVLGCYRNGSVIRSWLVDLMHEAYDKDFESVPDYIEDTGEVNWLVADAVRMEVPAPIITQSVIQLFASRDPQRDWAKAIALMRQGFGGHPLGPEPHFAQKRKNSLVGPIVGLPTSLDKEQ
jgi:6-phosphogluconate dehydrogenase